MGLIELCKSLKLKGRTMYAKTKGMMFFFLACRQPAAVKFPEFGKKQKRNPDFSLSEKGRLVGIMSDPANMAGVNKLMSKWNRAELDACAGDKGVAHY